jgi:hypothetical protein
MVKYTFHSVFIWQCDLTCFLKYIKLIFFRYYFADFNILISKLNKKLFLYIFIKKYILKKYLVPKLKEEKRRSI